MRMMLDRVAITVLLDPHQATLSSILLIDHRLLLSFLSIPIFLWTLATRRVELRQFMRIHIMWRRQCPTVVNYPCCFAPPTSGCTASPKLFLRFQAHRCTAAVGRNQNARRPAQAWYNGCLGRAVDANRAEFIDVDPSELYLPPSRRQGADPGKLARQINKATGNG